MCYQPLGLSQSALVYHVFVVWGYDLINEDISTPLKVLAALKALLCCSISLDNLNCNIIGSARIPIKTWPVTRLSFPFCNTSWKRSVLGLIESGNETMPSHYWLQVTDIDALCECSLIPRPNQSQCGSLPVLHVILEGIRAGIGWSGNETSVERLVPATTL